MAKKKCRTGGACQIPRILRCAEMHGRKMKKKCRENAHRSLDRTEVLHQVAGERNLLEVAAVAASFFPKVWCSLKDVDGKLGCRMPVMLLSVATWGERTRSTSSDAGIRGNGGYRVTRQDCRLRVLRSPQRSSVIRDVWKAHETSVEHFWKTLLDFYCLIRIQDTSG